MYFTIEIDSILTRYIGYFLSRSRNNPGENSMCRYVLYNSSSLQELISSFILYYRLDNRADRPPKYTWTPSPIERMWTRCQQNIEVQVSLLMGPEMLLTWRNTAALICCYFTKIFYKALYYSVLAWPFWATGICVPWLYILYIFWTYFLTDHDSRLGHLIIINIV